VLDRQLAELLVQIGLDRGTDVDTIAQELSTLKLPQFVDAEAFRASLLTAIETQLRRQTDERIRKLREQLAVPSSSQPVMPAPPAPPAPPASEPQGRVNLPTDASGAAQTPAPAPPLASPVLDQFQTIVEPAGMPKDATMIWKSRPDQGR
jgi:hypothetical protein